MKKELYVKQNIVTFKSELRVCSILGADWKWKGIGYNHINLYVGFVFCLKICNYLFINEFDEFKLNECLCIIWCSVNVCEWCGVW